MKTEIYGMLKSTGDYLPDSSCVRCWEFPALLSGSCR